MPRFAFSEPSIGSTTTSVAPSPIRPTSSETIVTPPAACSRATIASSAALSIAVVSSPPRPCPTTGSRSARVGSSTSTARTSATHVRHTSSQSVIDREEEQPARQLRIEERALLRHHVAAPRDLPHVVDPRRAEQERALGVAAVDRRLGVGALRRVRHALGMDRVDHLRIEPVALQQLVPAVPAIEDRSGEVITRTVDRLSG